MKKQEFDNGAGRIQLKSLSFHLLCFYVIIRISKTAHPFGKDEKYESRIFGTI